MPNNINETRLRRRAAQKQQEVPGLPYHYALMIAGWELMEERDAENARTRSNRSEDEGFFSTMFSEGAMYAGGASLKQTIRDAVNEANQDDE